MTALQAVVAVRFDERGDISYHVIGDERVRFFIIDERAPHDRVYEWTSRQDPAELRELIPAGTAIGSSSDERHAAIEHLVACSERGERHLSAVPSDSAWQPQ